MLYSYQKVKKNSTDIIDPTKWLCIWFTTKPEIFITDLNKQRIKEFIKNNIFMRKKPFKLSIIYKSGLFNKEGLADFEKFKAELYEIQRVYEQVDFVDFDSLEEFSLEDDLEKYLYDRANEDLVNIPNGGNPAAASDIVRLLKGARNRGNYFDLDVCILQEQDQEIAKLQMQIYQNNNSDAIEVLHSEGNNDVIIFGTEEKNDYINKLQNTIKDFFESKEVFLSFLISYISGKIFSKIEEEIIDRMHLEHGDLAYGMVISDDEYNKNDLEKKKVVKELIDLLTNKGTDFLNNFSLKNRADIQEYFEKLPTINPITKLRCKIYILHQYMDIEKRIMHKEILKEALEILYKLLVVETTGPGIYSQKRELHISNTNNKIATVFKSLVALNQHGISNALSLATKRVLYSMLDEELYSTDGHGDYSWGLTKFLK